MQKIGDEDYWIYQFDSFLTDNECDQLIEYSNNKKFEPSVVFVGNATEVNSTRASLTTWIKDSENAIVDKVYKKASELTKYDRAHFENLQIVKYDKNGFFKLHYDVDNHNKNSRIADRQITILIYLNDDYSGGGTEFPQIDLKVQPKKGKAIMFWSLGTEHSNLLEKSYHQGLPVTKGNKWIANLWIHLKPFAN